MDHRSSRVERYRVFHSESQLFAKKYLSTKLEKPHNFEKYYKLLFSKLQ